MRRGRHTTLRWCCHPESPSAGRRQEAGARWAGPRRSLRVQQGSAAGAVAQAGAQAARLGGHVGHERGLLPAQQAAPAVGSTAARWIWGVVYRRQCTAQAQWQRSPASSKLEVPQMQALPPAHLCSCCTTRKGPICGGVGRGGSEGLAAGGGAASAAPVTLPPSVGPAQPGTRPAPPPPHRICGKGGQHVFSCEVRQPQAPAVHASVAAVVVGSSGLSARLPSPFSPRSP